MGTISAERESAGEELTAGERKIASLIQERDTGTWMAFLMEAQGVAREGHEKKIAEYLANHPAGGAISWGTLLNNVLQRLLELGINPAGPAASLQSIGGEPWWRFFPSPSGFDWDPLPPNLAKDGRGMLVEALSHHVVGAIFDRGGRDLESIGVAYVVPSGKHGAKLGTDDETAARLLGNVLRMLGQAKYFEGAGRNTTSEEAPTLSSCSQDIARGAVASRLFEPLVPTSLDRKRMDRLLQKGGRVDQLLASSGQAFTCLRGHGGTGKTVTCLQAAWRAFHDHAERTLVITYIALTRPLDTLVITLGITAPIETAATEPVIGVRFW